MPTPSIWTMYWPQRQVLPSLRALHAQGWRWFELCFEHLEEIDESPGADSHRGGAARLEDWNLRMPQAPRTSQNIAHPDPARRAADLALLGRQLECAAALGVRDVVIHPGTAQSCGTEEEWQPVVPLNLEAFERLGQHAQRLGLRIGLENMLDDTRRGGEFGAQAEELVEFVRELACPRWASPSTAPTRTPGAAYGEVVRTFGDLLWCTHLSDNDRSGDRHRTPGYGTIDWPAVATAFREIGYQGRLTLRIRREEFPAVELLDMKVRHAREVTEWLARMVGGENREPDS